MPTFRRYFGRLAQGGRTGVTRQDGILRCKSTSTASLHSTTDVEFIKAQYVVHRRGEHGNYGSREYLLLPPKVKLHEFQSDPSVVAAALLAHRNVMFGARWFIENPDASVAIASPLVEAALADASSHGEQPQALASLAGLSHWVQAQLDDDQPFVIHNFTETELQAIRAIATGVPRPGHSVVGVGTYRDGERAWKTLAKEFCRKHSPREVKLYGDHGAELVDIEHLADKSPHYLQLAGGAMARLFFL